jgi:hypothetical protein
MIHWPGHSGASPEQRVEVREYLRDTQPLVETLDQEYETWLDIAAEEDSHTLSFERDPDGQHAAVYLWRVSQPAVDFTQGEAVALARRYYESYALCLEARAAAADLVKQATDLAPLKDPGPKIAEANRKLAEADRYWDRAKAERQRLETRLQAP